MRPSDPCNADVTLSKSHKNESQSHELHTRTPNLNLTNLIDEWIDWCQWGRLVSIRPSAPCHVNVTLYETKFMTRNDSLSWLSWHDSNHATLNVTTKWSVSSISKKNPKMNVHSVLRAIRVHSVLKAMNVHSVLKALQMSCCMKPSSWLVMTRWVGDVDMSRIMPCSMQPSDPFLPFPISPAQDKRSWHLEFVREGERARERKRKRKRERNVDVYMYVLICHICIDLSLTFPISPAREKRSFLLQFAKFRWLLTSGYWFDSHQMSKNGYLYLNLYLYVYIHARTILWYLSSSG